jgi:hypothetical protein
LASSAVAGKDVPPAVLSCELLCCVVLYVQQGQGAAALQDYVIQALTWEEVQGLAGPGVVGLPLGYTPSTVVVPPVLAVASTSPQLLGGDARKTGSSLSDPTATTQLLCSPSADDAEGSETQDGGHDALAAVADQQVQTADVAADTLNNAEMACVAPEGRIEGRDSVLGRLSWHRVGWTRAQYVAEAVAAANRMQ